MGLCFAGARAPSLLLLSGSGLKFTLSDMPKGFGTSNVGNTGKGSGKGHPGGTGGKGQGTGGKAGGPPQVSKGAGKHGQNKHAKGSVGWQAACDAYARVIGQPAAAGESVAAGAKAQQFWACRGPGGCQHDKNPGGPSGTKVCLSCGLPWESSARPALWAGLAARQAAAKAATDAGLTTLIITASPEADLARTGPQVLVMAVGDDGTLFGRIFGAGGAVVLRVIFVILISATSC